MKNKRTIIFACMLALVSCRKTSPVDIRVASAANVQQAMEEIARSFEAETGWKAGIIPGSSGKLTAQIEQGAPYDVFVSADTLYPNALHAMQRTIGSPVTYAHGTLVLWWRDSSLQMDYSRLADAQISHIALPNPKTAPYGRAALQALEKSGYLSALAPRLIYGESVSQASQFMFSGAAQAGFTAQSVVLAAQAKESGKWLVVADTLYDPIIQSMVLLKTKNGNSEAALAFFNYMQHENAQKVLIKYGYSVP